MELKTAEEALGKELAEVYRREYQKLTDRDADLLYMPATDKAKWWCSCGVMNLIAQMHCRVCGASIADLSRIMWKDYLQGLYDREHPEEAKAREAEAAAKAEEEERQKAEEEARLKAEEEERQKAEEEARLKAEEEARQKAEEEARQKAEEEARQKAEEEARLKAEEEARQRAEEEARLKAEEEARLKAEEEARLKAEEEARLKAEEEARLKAEEEARLKAEEEARQKAEEEEARRKAEEEAIGQVEAAAPEEVVERQPESEMADESEEESVMLTASRPDEPEPERLSVTKEDEPELGKIGAMAETHNEYSDTRLVGTWDASTYFDTAKAAPPVPDSVIGFSETEDATVSEMADVSFPDDEPGEVVPEETATIEFPGGEDDLADSTLQVTGVDEEEENSISIPTGEPEEEAVEETAEEAVEQTEEVVEETAEEPVEEPVEEVLEEAADEIVEESADEPIEAEVPEEPIEEPAEDDVETAEDESEETEEPIEIYDAEEKDEPEEPDLSAFGFDEQPAVQKEQEIFAMDIDDLDTNISAVDEYDRSADEMPIVQLEEAQEMPGFGEVQTMEALPEEDMVEFLELPEDSVHEPEPRKKGLFAGLFGKKKTQKKKEKQPEIFTELKLKDEEPETKKASDEIIQETEQETEPVEDTAEELTFEEEISETATSEPEETPEEPADLETIDLSDELADAEEMIDLSEEEPEQQYVEFPDEPEEELPELSSEHGALTHFKSGITEDMPMDIPAESEKEPVIAPEPAEEENVLAVEPEEEEENILAVEPVEEENILAAEPEEDEDVDVSEFARVSEEPELEEIAEPEPAEEPEPVVELEEAEPVIPLTEPESATDAPKVVHDDEGNPTIVFPDAPAADSRFGDMDELDFPDATIPEAPMPDPIDEPELPRIEFPDGPQLEHVMNPDPENREKARPFRNPGAAKETPSGLESEAPADEPAVPEQGPTEMQAVVQPKKGLGRSMTIAIAVLGALLAIVLGYFVVTGIFGASEADRAVEAANDSIGKLEESGIPTQEDFNKALNDYNSVPYDRKNEVAGADVLEKYKDVDLKTVRDIATRMDELNEKTPFAEVIALESEFEKLTMQEKQFVHGEKLDEHKQLNDSESTALKAVSNIRSLLTNADNFKPTSIKVKDDTSMSMAFRMEITYSYVDEQGTVKENTTYLSMMSVNDDVAYNAAVNSGKPEDYIKSTKDKDAYVNCESEEEQIDCDKMMYYLE